jgi:hypothetical protein
MLINKRPLFVGVALDTNRVPTGQGPHLAESSGAVDVVAVAALDEAFVYPVVIRLREVGLRIDMTSVAEFGLRSNQQMLLFFGVMRRVAVQASNVVAGVRRSGKVPLLMIFTVATQAAGVGVLLRHRLEANDFGYVPAALNVRRSGTVTGLAAVPVVQGGLEVGGILEVLLVQVFVAGLANIYPNVLSCLLGRMRNIFFLRARKQS